MRSHGDGRSDVRVDDRARRDRGEHYHLRKIERFVVLEGEAEIALRSMFTDEVLDVPGVTATPRSLIDMPTMWVAQHHQHRRHRADHAVLDRQLFDPEHPDTFREPVDGGRTQERRVTKVMTIVGTRPEIIRLSG